MIAHALESSSGSPLLVVDFEEARKREGLERKGSQEFE